MLRVADGMDATRRIARGRGCGGQCADKTALPSSGRAQIALLKDNASKRKASGLAISRAQLILCKDNASERKASGLAISRARLILCKDTTFYCVNQMFGHF